MQKRRERREERYRSEEGGGERNISIQIPTSSQQISNSWLHLGRFAQRTVTIIVTLTLETITIKVTLAISSLVSAMTGCVILWGNKQKQMFTHLQFYIGCQNWLRDQWSILLYTFYIFFIKLLCEHEQNKGAEGYNWRIVQQWKMTGRQKVALMSNIC